MPDRVVAALADCSDRKPVIGRLEFLQAHNIGLFVGKPALQVGQAAVNTVDIVGGDFQSSKSVGDDETSTARQRIGHGRAFHILTVKSVAGPERYQITKVSSPCFHIRFGNSGDPCALVG